MLFHEQIARRIAMMRKVIEPKYEMGENDHVLGTMSDKLKKLFTIYHKTCKEVLIAKKAGNEAFMKIIFSLENESDMDKVRKDIAQVFLIEEREKALKAMFWVSVKDEFPELKKELIGKALSVGRGFKVAWREPEEELISAEDEVLIMFSD
jgi:hypothetical protein